MTVHFFVNAVLYGLALPLILGSTLKQGGIDTCLRVILSLALPLLPTVLSPKQAGIHTCLHVILGILFLSRPVLSLKQAGIHTCLHVIRGLALPLLPSVLLSKNLPHVSCLQMCQIHNSRLLCI